jgi:HEAT repeat protein
VASPFATEWASAADPKPCSYGSGVGKAGGGHERATRLAARAAGGRLDAAEWTQCAELAAHDPDSRVRAIAISALVRAAPQRVAAPIWRKTANDGDPAVRRRVAEVAPHLGGRISSASLVTLLGDDDAWVAEAAAYALGEHPRPSASAVTALVTATEHTDPLVREAAVAALGALGRTETLPAVLRACDDKPAIRRRAVLALAAFEGPEVEARLDAALEDRDWQVRQAAEDLVSARRSEP